MYESLFYILDIRDSLALFSEEPLTRQIQMDLLTGYKRPFDKMSELLIGQIHFD